MTIENNGNPYVSLRNGIAPGGLDTGDLSDPVTVSFTNPQLLPLNLAPKVLVGGENQPPSFQPVSTLTVKPGERLTVPLEATDSNGDKITFSLKTEQPLPNGQLKGNGTLEFTPTPEQLGTYTFTIIASDGLLQTSQEVTLEVAADPVTTTRISGVIQNTDLEPLVGVVIELGELQTVTAADGSFKLETAEPLTADTLLVRGDLITGSETYPFIPEKLSLLLGREVYQGSDNIIHRTIYLPPIDTANAVTVDPAVDTTVTTAAITGAEVFVAAGSLENQQGQAFTGQLSITQVPNDLTPAALPENLVPDLVVTIQPGEMVFNTPAPLTLPNIAGYPPGTVMDLWSINPETGDFDKVGQGQVSADGTVVETIQGGIRNSSWHMFTPPPKEPEDPEKNPNNPDEEEPECLATCSVNSEVELHSGALIETHNLVSYQSLGTNRSLTLTYDSFRADPRPIVHFSYENISDDPDNRLVAKLEVSRGDFVLSLPGYSGTEYGLVGGEHFWSIPEGGGNIDAALQADLSHQPNGKYEYEITSGIRRFTGNLFAGTSTTSRGDFLHINTIHSAFGSGWGLAGLIQLIENEDGSILLIDGDGSELLFEEPLTPGSAYVAPGSDFSTLEKLENGTFRRTLLDETVQVFNSQHQLDSVTEPDGNQTQYIYDQENRLSKIIDPVGLETSFTYTQEKVTSITDPAGRTTQLEYDPAGNLVQVTEPDGSSRTWEYDTSHHMIAEVDQRGHRESTFYDFAGRVSGGLRKDGSQIQVAPVQVRGLYSPEETVEPLSPPVASLLSDAVSSYTDGNGNVIAAEVDQASRLVSSVDGEGFLPKVERNQENLITKLTDGRGNSTEYTYDQQGNVVSIKDKISKLSASSQLFPNPVYKLDNDFDELIVADLNGDSIDDLVAYENSSYSNTVSVLLGNGDGSFDAASSYSTGGGYDAQVAVADLNGNDFLDLAVLNQPNYYSLKNQVTILLNAGNGSFPESSQYNGDNNQNWSNLNLTKLNGDDFPDLLLTDDNGDGVSVLLNNGEVGDGTFTDFTDYPLDFDSDENDTEILLQDINGDDIVDLLATSSEKQKISLLLNDGDGTFNPATNYSLEARPLQLALADINGDGADDILTANRSQPSLSVLLNKDNGSFSHPTNYALANQPHQLELVDLNGDSLVDVVVGMSNLVAVFLNTEDGTLEPTDYQMPSANSSEDLVIADLNGDGFLDLLGVDRLGQSVTVRLNDGNGTFANNRNSTLPASPNNWQIEDLNGDNLPDLLATNSNNTMSVLLNLGDGSFANGVDYLAGEDPIVTLSDLNQDGFVDALINLHYNNTFSVLLNLADGSFAGALLEDTLPLGDNPVDVSLVDLNQDKYLDLITLEGELYGTDRTVSVSLGNGDGTFASSQSYSVNNNANDMTVGDFDNDGNLDLVVVGRNTVLLLGNGSGAFAAPTVVLSEPAWQVTASDVNSDGRLDLITTYKSGLSLALGSSSGGFVPGTKYQLGRSFFSNFISHVLVADTNNDGWSDLIVAQNNDSVSVLLANGDGSFEVQNSIPVEDGPTALQVGHLNSDGFLDLIVANFHDNNVSVLLGNGDGNFGATTVYPVGESPRDLAVLDLDGDSLLDLVTTNSSDDTVSVLLGVGDGTFIQNQPRDFLVGERPVALALGDLDGDGRLDLVTANFFDDTVSVRLNGKLLSQETGERTYTYDPIFNQVTSFTDELGRTTLYEIDPNTGNQLSVTRVVGEIGGDDDVVTSYTYTPSGLIDTITEPLGRVTDYDYDELGRLVKITFALGTVDEAIQQFEYDLAGNQTAIIDADGNRTEYEYDTRNRLVRTVLAVGTSHEAVQSTEYDGAGNRIATVDSNGNRTEFEYDALNRLVRIVAPDPDGAGPLTSPITTYSYDGAGNLLLIADPLERKTEYVYDSRNRLVSTILPDGSVISSSYDFDNNPTVSLDGNGNPTNSVYDSRGRLTSSIDALGNKTSYQYDAANQLVAVVDANGHRTQYEYDELGRQVAVIDAAGNVSRTEYDKAGNVVAEIDANGNTTYFEYDALNRQIAVTDAEGGTTSTTYDRNGNVLTITDELGRTTTYAYDSRNRSTTITDPLGGVTSYSYDANSNLLATTDRLGGTTSYSYDGLNRRISLTDPLSNITNYVYDGVNNLTKVVDALGRTTSYSYDSLNQTIAVTNPQGETISTAYDGDGNVIAITDPLGRTTSYGYDELNRRVTVTNPLDGTVTTTYDGVGNIIAVTDELGRTTTFTYDERNLQTALIDELGNQTTTEYDRARNVIAITDGSGNRTSYSLDALYRRIGVTDASGETTTFTYDQTGNLLSLTDPVGNTTTNTYDELNRLLTETNQLGLTSSYQYDAVGNLLTVEDRNGRVRSFDYDQLNRKIAEHWLDGDGNSIRTINSTYDAVSQLLRISDPDSSYTYTYDLAGRVTSVDNAGTPGIPHVVLNYSYDPAGNVLSVTDTISGQLAGIESFVYNELNRVTQITQTGNGVTDKRVDFSYNGASQMTGIVRYSDLAGSELVGSSSYSYDRAGRLINLTHNGDSEVIADYAWLYDGANRITQFTNPDGAISYTYDERGQLTGAESDYQADESYSYDGNGNRTNPGYSTGSNNRLLSDGIYNYQYDGEGNRTVRTEIATGEVTEYSWDYRNRLIGVVTLDSEGNILETNSYTYDVFNRRLSKSAQGSVLEVFVYDGEHIALVFDGDGTQKNRYLHGPNVDQIIADEDGSGSVLWALVDNLGTVRYVVGNDGAVLNRISYDSFGSVIDETNPSISLRFDFTGRELDPETGLVYYRGRYYDGERFISEDPIGFAGGDGNLYRYTFNSPTNFTDPSGHCVSAAGLGIAVGAASADGTLPFGDAFAGGYLIGDCLVTIGIIGTIGNIGLRIRRLLDDRPPTPWKIPRNGPETKPEDTPTPTLAPPPPHPDRNRETEPTVPSAPVKDPNDCDGCDKEYPLVKKCEAIRKGNNNILVGFQFETINEAEKDLNKKRRNQIRKTGDPGEKAWWSATSDVGPGTEPRGGSVCPDPKGGALHYNVEVDPDAFFKWRWRKSSVGSLARCKCCKDTGQGPEIVERYAILNIKNSNGDKLQLIDLYPPN